MKPHVPHLDDPDAPEEDDDDPLQEEILRDAIDPYKDVLTPEQVADHRAFLTVFLATHPVAAPMYERLRARRRASAASAEITREGAHTDDTLTSPRPADVPARKVGG